MGFMSGLGKALMAPIKATNKVANKIPGVKQTVGVMNKIPGMQTANKFNPMMQGLGSPKPPVGINPRAGGIGPSPQMTPTPVPQGPSSDSGGGITGGGMVHDMQWRGDNGIQAPRPIGSQLSGIPMGGGMPGGIGPQQNMLQQLMQRKQQMGNQQAGMRPQF